MASYNSLPQRLSIATLNMLSSRMRKDSKKEMERKAKEMVSQEGENEDTEDSAQAVASSSTSKNGSSNG